MFLEGYKHYVTAAIMLVLALGGYMDPQAVTAFTAFLAAFGIQISGTTILMVCGLIVVALKKLEQMYAEPDPVYKSQISMK